MKLEEAINKLKETQDSYLKDELDEAIETVLQELERLQKENEQQRIEVNSWQDKIREKIKKLEDEEKAELGEKNKMILPKDTAYLFVRAEYHNKKEILQAIESLINKCKEQEKMIEMMGKDIADYKLDKDICRQVKDPANEDCYTTLYYDDDCSDCVIEYYKKKAREKDVN